MKKKLLIPDKKVFECLDKMSFIQHNLVLNGTSTYDSYHLKNNDEALNIIVKKFLNMAGKKYRLLEIWANRYKKGGCVKKHNHLPSVKELYDVPCKSGVYFFKKPKLSGDFVLNGEKQNVEEGDIILFDCDKEHYSLPNSSNEERIVFSINMAKNVEKVWNNNKFEFKKI